MFYSYNDDETFILTFYFTFINTEIMKDVGRECFQWFVLMLIVLIYVVRASMHTCYFLSACLAEELEPNE